MERPGFFQCEVEEKMISASARPIYLNLQVSVQSGPRNQNYEESKHESPLPKEGFIAFRA